MTPLDRIHNARALARLLASVDGGDEATCALILDELLEQVQADLEQLQAEARTQNVVPIRESTPKA